MERAVEERKPRREGGRHDRVVKSRQNGLARAFTLEEEDDLARREEDLPAVDAVRDDRLDMVGEELLCSFALAGLEASYENDPVAGAHAGQSRPLRLWAWVEREHYRAAGAAGHCALKCGRRVGQRESRHHVQ
jgi:hypothetical protein